MASENWYYELYYWDYTAGILLFALLLVFTLGGFGSGGRGFSEDIQQLDNQYIISALIGGVIFSASNILLSASASMAGMTVAFPLGVGLALALGVFVNYFSAPKGDPFWLFSGVILIVIATICNGIVARENKKENTSSNKKGIILAATAGILMPFFYRFVATAMNLNNFESSAPGMATPYTAFSILVIGIFLSNFFFSTLVMKHPFVGSSVSYREYFAGKISTHMMGILGGCIWGLGTALSHIAAEKAGAAILYALGQGAPMIAALWGVFIQKEFIGSSKSTNRLLGVMFVLFVIGLSFIVLSGGS